MTYKMIDNTFLRDKVQLRLNNLPPGELNVLDYFAGKGLVWAAVQRLSGRTIAVLPIDKRDDLDAGFHLPGDNLDYLESLDLTRFNVIDLDSYGTPIEQLECLFRRKYRGTVFATIVASNNNTWPLKMLEAIGFTREQYEKCKTVMYGGKRGWEYVCQYLATRGVTRIRSRSMHNNRNQKHYVAFTL